MLDWSTIFQGLAGYGNVGEGGLPGDALPAPAPFQSRWPTPGMTAETMPTMEQSPITPENIAKTMASRGIAPPPVDIPLGASLTGTGTGLPGDTPYRMPDQPDGVNPTDKWRAGVDENQTLTPGAPASPVTASGVPNPTVRATDMSAQSASGEEKKGDKTPSLADSLRGVKAPASPELQRLGTPAAPRPTNQIKGGEIIALLQAMNAGGAAAGNYQLPSTLGQALLGRK